MKRGLISIIALTLSMSLWPSVPGLAAADFEYSATVGKITNTHTRTSGLFQLAKQNDENDKGDKEGKHGAHHGRYHEKKGKVYPDQQFCGMCCNFENGDGGCRERNWAARSQAARSNSLSMN